MLYRKEEIVIIYFQTYDLKAKWNEVSSFYKESAFEKINNKWSKKINEIDMSTFIAGMYIIKVTGADWTVQKKIIKE